MQIAEKKDTKKTRSGFGWFFRDPPAVGPPKGLDALFGRTLGGLIARVLFAAMLLYLFLPIILYVLVFLWGMLRGAIALASILLDRVF